MSPRLLLYATPKMCPEAMLAPRWDRIQAVKKMAYFSPFLHEIISATVLLRGTAENWTNIKKCFYFNPGPITDERV